MIRWFHQVFHHCKWSHPPSLQLILGLVVIIFASHSKILAEKKQVTNSSLSNSDGSHFTAHASYPKFSWDVTPQYFMFGDSQRVLTPEEVQSIAARTGFICIEKAHGLIQLGAAELGAKHEAAAFRKAKPGIKVLYYFNSAYAYPFTSYTKNLTKNKLDQHPELKKFLLTDPKTGEFAKRGTVYQFDVLNPEFRTWWVSTVKKGVIGSGCDGVFIDQMHGFSWLRPKKNKEVKAAMTEMMASLKQELGSEKILLANNAQRLNEVLDVADANMFEHYNSKTLTKEALLRDWKDMLEIAKLGKISVFRIGVEADLNMAEEEKSKLGRGPARNAKLAVLAKEQLEYYHATYLIGAQPYSYFQYGWGWTLKSGSLVNFPALHKPLGAPKGAYTRTDKNTWVFTREFEHASVWVDTEKKQGKITWLK